MTLSDQEEGESASSLRAELALMTKAFRQRCDDLGIAVDPRLFWYHTVDLGDGLVTPGSFDYRSRLPAFGLPHDMSAMRVLDIGSATGFFAFEMARRGATVTSVEIPALTAWDHFPGESNLGIIEKIRRQMRFHTLPEAQDQDGLFAVSAEELHLILLDSPFQFCRQRLGFEIERVYASIYDLSEGPLRGRQFDLVMLGDILIHTIDPLAALAAAAGLCAGTLVIAQQLFTTADPTPALYYIGGDRPGADSAEWWRANGPWFDQVLRRLGFASVRQVGEMTGRLRPGGEVFQKTILHASR